MWLAHYYNPLIPAGASVLEIGCGSGELLRGLRAGRKVGVDLSATQIATARARVPDAEFHVSAGEDPKAHGEIRLPHHLRYVEPRRGCAGCSKNCNYITHADTRLIINYYSALWRPDSRSRRSRACGRRSRNTAG